MNNGKECVHTHIWMEEPETGNPFATRAAYCRGYDVYGDMLGRARWTEMVYLLFRGEAPTLAEANLFEALAVALSNPGPRDHSVHAAMCGGVGGSTAASCLMAALAAGAGQNAGAREIFLSMESWAACGTNLDAWRQRIIRPAAKMGSVWPVPDHTPGFDPHGVNVALPVTQTLDCLASLSTGTRLPWLKAHRQDLENCAKLPLALLGVAAAALTDLGFSPEQGEMLCLLLRLPGAAAHALEQHQVGYRNFPLFSIELENDPAKEAK